MLPTVNNFNVCSCSEFQDDESSHLFCRKFCLIGNIFLLGIFYSIFIKTQMRSYLSRPAFAKRPGVWNVLDPTLCSISSLFKIPSQIHRLLCTIQTSFLSWMHFPQEQACQASVTSSPTLTGCFSGVLNRWSKSLHACLQPSTCGIDLHQKALHPWSSGLHIFSSFRNNTDR